MYPPRLLSRIQSAQEGYFIRHYVPQKRPARVVPGVPCSVPHSVPHSVPPWAPSNALAMILPRVLPPQPLPGHFPAQRLTQLLPSVSLVRSDLNGGLSWMMDSSGGLPVPLNLTVPSSAIWGDNTGRLGAVCEAAGWVQGWGFLSGSPPTYPSSSAFKTRRVRIDMPSCTNWTPRFCEESIIYPLP